MQNVQIVNLLQMLSKKYTDMIGKRVVLSQAVPVCYKTKPTDVVGILTYVGYNELLGNKLQATIGKMPIQFNNLQQLTLAE